MKKIVILIVLIVICIIPSLFAQENTDTSLYIGGLELLLEKNTNQAQESFSLLLDEFPGSQYAESSQRRLLELQNVEDNSGIVTFYLGNLATATYTAMRLPEIFGYSLDAIMAGVTGLAGVGTGLGSAWLMSKDHPISSAQDWWIESTQLISLGNYLYLAGIVEPYTVWKYPLSYKLELGGQLLTLLGSRVAAYTMFKDSAPPEGQGSFMLHSYFWANYYYLLFAGGILEIDDSKIASIGGIITTDLAVYGSLRLWDQLNWSPLRTGLVTVGGLGGGLIGFFTTMILEELASPDSKVQVSIMIASAAAGQAVAVWLTREMEPELSEKDYGISLTPIILPEKLGFQVGLRL
jgi:hypothetical protein